MREFDQNLRTYSGPGRIIELIGVAGTGKSTLFRSMDKITPWIQGELVPPVWQLAYFPFFTRNILAVVPAFTRLLRNEGRFLTRREMAFMALLNGWSTILRAKAQKNKVVYLLDHGPVAKIAYLLFDGPPGLRNANMDSWWKKVFLRWGQSLDMVVWLDASTDTLIRRIKNRQQQHTLKDTPDPEARDWLVRYHAVYESIVSHLVEVNPTLRVLRIDSQKNNVDMIITQLLNEFSREDIADERD